MTQQDVAAADKFADSVNRAAERTVIRDAVETALYLDPADQLGAVIKALSALQQRPGAVERERVARLTDDIVEAAIEAVWPFDRGGNSAGWDQLERAVAAYQIDTGAAVEDDAEDQARAILGGRS